MVEETACAPHERMPRFILFLAGRFAYNHTFRSELSVARNGQRTRFVQGTARAHANLRRQFFKPLRLFRLRHNNPSISSYEACNLHVSCPTILRLFLAPWRLQREIFPYAKAQGRKGERKDY